MKNCPFYGVTLVQVGLVPVFMADGGSQCALIWPDRSSACSMEVDGNAANWGHCPRNPQVNGTYTPPELIMRSDQQCSGETDARPRRRRAAGAGVEDPDLLALRGLHTPRVYAATNNDDSD